MESTTRPPSRHRRPRLPAASVRARMLDTASEMALEAGVGITIEDLSMEEVIQRARVPRSAVYRLWPYKGDFVEDLLCHLAGPAGVFGTTGVLDPATFELTRETISRHRDMLGSAEGRRAVLCEVIRLAVSSNYQAHRSSRWRIHTVLMAAVGSSRNIHARGEVASAIEHTETQARANIVGLTRYVIESLGYRFRNTAWTAEHLQTAGAGLLQGLAMRHDVIQAAAEHLSGEGQPGEHPANQIIDTPLPGPGLEGKPAEWTLAALAYLAIVDLFIEPDPDYQPPEDAAPVLQVPPPAVPGPS